MTDSLKKANVSGDDANGCSVGPSFVCRAEAVGRVRLTRRECYSQEVERGLTSRATEPNHISPTYSTRVQVLAGITGADKLSK